ncbi:leucine-rich repeat domain-containing protein [Cytophagaceae bacterium YF14B1]|uniref:Leucine-rich repeat domain-containing protein n=1 Tax=Xanthocytophaga flava TaxID=3048013 RepID=A0AAE3QSA3_9BACT|nr:leucine-rich repeat domain-containing protein [Xanthocytophaga flavus]MDJ1482585.1 leucine-rich repeat domain-containing protein [Xanthocytophaga flavus]
MKETSSEKENVMRLLLSGQQESIELGLAIAESLQIDIKVFLSEIETLYNWMTDAHQWEPEQWKIEGLPLSMKLAKLIPLTEIAHSGSQAPREFIRLFIIPAEIKYLVNLESLDLSLNSVYEIPPEIGFLTKLEDLDLSSNDLVSISPEIEKCQNLRSLNLHRTDLSNLPPEIGNCSQLFYLNLSYNKLKSLPSKIGELINLENLNLRYNQLTDLPEEIHQLVNLKYLDLAGNPLSIQEKDKIRCWLPNCAIIFE